MNRWLAIVVVLCVGCQAGAVQAWDAPEHGSPIRVALMDALRPHAEELLGAPIQFAIYDLRVDGDVAFASVAAMRPGGKGIDIYGTPGAISGELEPDVMDGTTFQALYVKSGDSWIAEHWAIGATDVWYSDPHFCPVFAPVLDDICDQ